MLNRNILVIEDEHDIAQLLKLSLDDICNQVVLVHDGQEGLELACSKPWDLILLDLKLPSLDGLEVCRRIRENTRYTPILMLTSKSSELDRVLGLEMGADDYLTKPFSVMELLARVKAIFRRVAAMTSQKEIEPNLIHLDSLSIDTDKRVASIDNVPVDLTVKEFDLLLHFAKHPGKVYQRANLLNQVWGLGYDGYEHTVNSHINRLRAKIEKDPSKPRFIVTVWGVGYKFGISP